MAQQTQSWKHIFSAVWSENWFMTFITNSSMAIWIWLVSVEEKKKKKKKGDPYWEEKQTIKTVQWKQSKLQIKMQHCMTKAAAAAGTHSRPVTTVYHTAVAVPEGNNTGTKRQNCCPSSCSCRMTEHFLRFWSYISDLRANYFTTSSIQHVIYSYTLTSNGTNQTPIGWLWPKAGDTVDKSPV